MICTQQCRANIHIKPVLNNLKIKVLAQFLSALFCGRQWMGPTCVNLSIFGSNMRWDQRSQLPEHNFSQYLIRSQNVAPLYTNIDIQENFPQNPQICSPCKCQESAEKATCKPFPPKSIIYSWPLVKCVEASGPKLASQRSGSNYFA